jgi:hypothetical protein
VIRLRAIRTFSLRSRSFVSAPGKPARPRGQGPTRPGQIPGGGAASNYTPRCSSPSQRLSQRLGIPPTTDVANPRWGLGGTERRIAASQVDAYMWLGRPWMVNAGPFSLRYALTLGANGAD